MSDQQSQEPNQQPPSSTDLLVHYIHRLQIRLRFYIRKVVPEVDKQQRAVVQVQLRDSSQPDFDYFVLVLLSCMIATFGLLIDSGATIIGAMLVAPLMSPILGLGLASIRGDTKLLRDAAIALGRGAILSILLSAFITWTNDLLPFVTLEELPSEVLSRTRPSPIDLGVALAGGLAATFALVQPQLSAALPGVAIATALMPPLCVVGFGLALGRWDVAGGAFLLFITNAVTIAASAISLFFVLGFNPARKPGGGVLPQSLKISMILTIVLLAPLGWQSYTFVQEATVNRQIEDVVKQEVANFGAEFEDWSLPIAKDVDGVYQIDIIIRVNRALSHSNSVALQDAIASELQLPIQLKINQVQVEKLDPAIPPTHTPTATLGPSATFTITVIPKTATPTRTYTPMPTATYTPTPTPTPAQAILDRPYGEGAYLRAEPDGANLAYLPKGTRLTVLYGYEIVDGWVWIEVMDNQGRRGWIPQFYTSLVSPTETPEP